MCSGFPVLVARLLLLSFLEAKACVVTKLVACLALISFGWALEPFKMSRISALATSILVFVSQSRIKTLLALIWRSVFTILLVCLLCGFCSFCTCQLLIQCTGDAWGWSGLSGRPQPLAWYVLLWPLNSPSSWPVGTPCLWGTCQDPCTFIYGFRNESPHLSEKKQQKDIPMKYLGCLWRVSGKIDLSLYSVVPLIYTSCTLSKACQEIKAGPYFIHLGLAELFKVIPDCIQAKVFFRQAPGHILVHAKVPTPSYYLLALLAFWECCKLTF